MRGAAAAVLALGLGACVTPLAECLTSDIYQEAVTTSGYGLMCSHRDKARFRERLEPLLPWLESRLGKEHVAQVLSGMEESLATARVHDLPDPRPAHQGADPGAQAVKAPRGALEAIASLVPVRRREPDFPRLVLQVSTQ